VGAENQITVVMEKGETEGREGDRGSVDGKTNGECTAYVKNTKQSHIHSAADVDCVGSASRKRKWTMQRGRKGKRTNRRRGQVGSASVLGGTGSGEEE